MTATPYHHGSLREALVDAAVLTVREGGAEGLALRDLARQVGVSHNAAYRHFANRDDLLAEVAGRVMGQLVEAMQRRLAAVQTTDPVLRARRRLAETGRAYVEFALDEPGLFRLAFSVASSASTISRSGPYLVLRSALDDLVDVGFLSAHGRVGAEITCWSAVHGFSVLAIAGALDEGAGVTPQTDEELARVLAAIDRSYAATTGSIVEAADLR